MQYSVVSFKIIITGHKNIEFWDFISNNKDLDVTFVETSLLGGYLVSVDLTGSTPPGSEGYNRAAAIDRIKELTESFTQFLPQASPVVGGPGGGIRRM